MSPTSQMLHVFSKDVRRYWPLVAFLGLLLTTDALLAPDTSRYYGGGVMTAILGGAGLRGTVLTLLMALITALVIHEDNASHRGAFWSSRPLTPLAVLAAKGLFLGIFLVALPLTFQAMAILEFGTLEALPGQLAQSAFYHGSFIAIVVALSAVTGDLKGTLLLGVAGFLGTNLVGALVSSGLLVLAGGQVFRVGRSLGPNLAVDTFMLAATLAIIVYQYGTRRTKDAIWAMGIFLILVPALAIEFVDTTQRPRMGFEVRPLDPAVPRPEVAVQALEFTPARRSSQGQGKDRIDAVIETTPTDYAVVPRMATLELRVRTSDGIDQRSRAPGRLYNPVQRYASLLPGYRWLGNAADWAQFDVVLLRAPAGTLAPTLDAIERIELETEWDAYNRVSLGSLPFKVGETLSSGPVRVAVEELVYGPTEMGVSLQATWVTGPDRTFSESPPGGQIRVVAVHHGRKEYLLGASSGDSRTSVALVLPGPQAVQYTINLRYPLGGESGTPDGVTRDWFDGAELWLFSNEYMGTFKTNMDSDLSEFAVATVPAGGVVAER